MKYLMMAALLAGFSSAAMAQDGTKADIDAVKKIISSKPADLDKQMKPYYKENKKNAENLAAFGRAFFEAKDTAHARIYAEYALQAVKNHQYAPAYLLLGDIKALADDGGAAAQYYDMAVYADPKDPTGYFKYANVYRKINPALAVGRLNDLRAQRPDIAVDALAGRIYYMANEFDKALAAYDKADKNKMEDRDITDYAMAAFFKQKNQKALEIAKFGLSKKPRSAAFNRLAFFNSTDLKQYDQALNYADALFNKSDSAKFSYYDYVYYGKALAGAKRHKEAVAMYEKALQQEDLDNKAKRAGVIKDLSDAYQEQEDYPNAIKHYEDYLKNVEKASANDIAALASLHMQHGGILQDAEAKKAAFMKADGVYADLAAKFENAAEYANFMRARVNAQLDPDSKLGLAKPYYEKLIELIEPRAQKDATERARIIESYRYMIAYNFIVKEDKEQAKMYAEKLIQIDPENEIAKQVLGATK